MGKKTEESSILAEIAVQGMQEKKGKSIVSIDLRSLKVSPTDYFVICHGDSDTQVKALADSVEEEIRNATGDKPIGREGSDMSRWVLLDYANVFVHIFQKEVREFYEIEQLWHDGEFKHFEDL